MQPNIENFIGCDSSYRAASIVLLPYREDDKVGTAAGIGFDRSVIVQRHIVER